MLREALEYIVGLGESKQHEINGSIYSDKELYRVDTYFPKAMAIELNTLTGLVDYIKSSTDKMPGKMIVDVKDPETVRLYSQLDPNRDRETLIVVRARVPEFYFNRFINQEEFCINMQSKFIDDTATDRALLLKFAGTVESGTLAEYGDDGVTQKATVKTCGCSKKCQDCVIERRNRHGRKEKRRIKNIQGYGKWKSRILRRRCRWCTVRTRRSIDHK